MFSAGEIHNETRFRTPEVSSHFGGSVVASSSTIPLLELQESSQDAGREGMVAGQDIPSRAPCPSFFEAGVRIERLIFILQQR
jgi:hypothetical protein